MLCSGSKKAKEVLGWSFLLTGEVWGWGREEVPPYGCWGGGETSQELQAPGADQGPGAETDKVSSLSPAPPELLQEPQVPLLMPSLCLALAQHCLSNF